MIEQIPEQEPNIEALREQFRQEILDAAEMVRELDARAVFEDLESYQGLKQNPEAVAAILKETFGFEENEEFLAEEHSMQGTPGSEGEGEIKVRVFKTNDSEVFLGRYEYQNGDVVWALRPKELEDEK